MPAIRPSRDDGAAVAEFVMVGSLLMLVFAGVIQVSLVLHARNVFAAAAAEGARYAASARGDPEVGRQRAEELTRAALSDAVASDIPCEVSTEDASGLEIRTVTCDGSLPLLFLPLGRVHLHVTGHALVEPS